MSDKQEKTSSLEDEYADRLSAGTYALKKIKEVVITAGGVVGGWFAGRQIDKYKGYGSMLSDTHAEILDAANPGRGARLRGLATPVAVLGAAAGSIVSGIALAYGHWRKEESQKLAVDEINRDIANMKIRQRTDPELLKENDRLRAMLEQEEQKNAAPGDGKAGSHAAKVKPPGANFAERAAATSGPREIGA